MNVETITTTVFPTGQNQGIPCTLIEMGGEIDVDSNSIIEDIKQSGLKTVCFSGKITENPECRTIARDLCGVGYHVIMLTDATDSIEPLRMIKGLRFSIKIEAPTETENLVNPKNLPLLKEADELIFKIDSLSSYQNVKRFLESRVITRPMVSLVVSDKVDEVVSEYLTHAGKFIFPTRLYVRN